MHANFALFLIIIAAKAGNKLQLPYNKCLYGNAIDCFQCNSSLTMECGDRLMKLDGGILEASSCEHVYDAQYCIKQTGGINTKRFCSSLDLGNYCNYVKQPGDKMQYRTCVYTCSTDGCNKTIILKTSVFSTLIPLSLCIFK